ncbi:MAG: cobalamin-dependent protein [Gemmatimonas sp.]
MREPVEGIAGRPLWDAIESNASRIAARVTDRQFADDPALHARWGDRGRVKCTEDALRHLSYVSAAAMSGSDALFDAYVGWARILLGRLGLTEQHLAQNLSYLRDALLETLPEPSGRAAAAIVERGLVLLPSLPSTTPSDIETGDPFAELATTYLNTLIAGDRQAASALILDAVNAGTSVRDIYLYVFQRSQHEIGRRWQLNEMTVAEEHFCTAATQLIMSQLYPRIFATARRNRKLVAACVGGDLHEIGVRMVADFFEMDGWDTYYLGANMPTAAIVDTVAERRPDVLAISATMTFHVKAVRDLIDTVHAAAATSSQPAPRILVGGYPFSIEPGLWRTVGADGCAGDADEAVRLANRLVDQQYA